MTRRLLVPVLVVVGLLAGCGGGDGEATTPSDGSTPAPSLGGGAAATSAHTLEVDGLERRYLVHEPSSLPADEAVPVVIFLHGGTGSGEQLGRTIAVEEHAEQGGYLAVLPDGTTNAEGRFRTWNGGGCCGPAAANDVDDVAFIDAVLDDVAGQWDVDPDRVYVAGHSNGAIMANRLACDRPGTFAAIAAVAGSLETDCEDGAPTNVLYVHGDADTNHPIEGGIGSGIAGVPFTSVEDSLATWRAVGGCDDEGDEVVDGPLTTTTWATCADGVEVELQVLAGAAHPWPGADPSLPTASGPPSQDLDATEAVWTFFEAHPRR